MATRTQRMNLIRQFARQQRGREKASPRATVAIPRTRREANVRNIRDNRNPRRHLF